MGNPKEIYENQAKRFLIRISELKELREYIDDKILHYEDCYEKVRSQTKINVKEME